MTADVVVIGGGISGLVSAFRLDQRGARVILVERSPRLGGIVETWHDDGYVIETGPDSFVAGKGSVLRLAKELGIQGDVISNRAEQFGSQVWWDGRLHPLPGGLLLMVPTRLGPLLGTSLLSWDGKARVLADLVLPRAAPGEDESLESFVRRRLGHQVLERIAQPLVAGIHGAEPDTMSLRASFPRFLEMERSHRSLLLAARAVRRQTSPEEGQSHFASFIGGMGRLVSSLTQSLGSVEVRSGVEAMSLSRADGPNYLVGLDDGSEVRASAVVVATPAPIASQLLGDLSPEAAANLSGIGQVPVAAVNLAYRNARLPPLVGSGFLVPSAQHRAVTGVSYLSHKWEGRAPAGHTLIRVFVKTGPSTGVGQDPHALTSVASRELEALIGITAPPTRTWVVQRQAGLHRYTLGHVDRLSTAEAALSRHPGLVLAGGGFHGIGLNECIDSAERAADKVSASGRIAIVES